MLKKEELVRVLLDWDLPAATGCAVFPRRRVMPAKTRAFLDMLDEACCAWVLQQTESRAA